MDDLIYKIAITQIPLVGDVMAKKLIAYCGGVEAVFKEKKNKLMTINGVGEALANAISKQNVLQRAEEEIKFIEKYKIQTYFYLDSDYPTRLKQCNDSPVMLYHKGNTELNNEKIIGIVGTRNASEYGKNITEKLIEEIAYHKPLIVSGLAYGIDICAHKAALKNDLQTTAVLAHGLDRVYPQLHKPIAEQIIKNGGLLTDYLSKTNPDRENFPSRNRIVAGMCDAIIVIEAGVKGGALITAEIANNYNRDVFAVPGRLGDEFSAGCNRLIKINKAALIESAADIEYLLGWKIEKTKSKKQQKQLFVELSADEEIVTKILQEKGNQSIDDICIQSNFSMGKISAILLSLEFSGIVKSLPGKVYELN